MHPIFMVARIPIFLVYALFTCCCDKGDDLPEGFPYHKLMISYEFVERELQDREDGHNNELFRNAPWEEWRANRDLRNIRVER